MRKNKVFAYPHKYYKSVIYFLFTPLFLMFIFYVYYNRAVSFSFIDEYNNYMAGYFLLQHKTMYSQIFFQHQPIMAYISAVLQSVFHPSSLYKLVLYHRLFVLIFSLLFDILLIYRFRFLGLFFTVFYETTKYYLFGSLFLGESLIVYCLVYLFCLAWQKLDNQAILNIDIVFSGLLTYFICFIREPFIPVTIVLFVFLMFGKLKKSVIISISIFLLLAAVTIFTLPFKDYIFDLTAVNSSVIQGETQANGVHGIGILQIFIYPILLFIGGRWNIFREIILSLDVVFLATCGVVAYVKKIKELLFVMIILGLAGIRIVIPGTTFYEAYHIVPWFGLFLISCVSLIDLVHKNKHKKIFAIVCSVVILILCFIFLSPQIFFREQVDRNIAFNTSYGRFFLFGSAIQDLSKPSDTLFVDSWDSLIYWQANLPIAYPYLFYYPPMNDFSVYDSARTKMFASKPPDFYYNYCGEIKYYSPGIPKQYQNKYKELYNKQGKSCLYVLNSKLATVTNQQWNKAKTLGFYLP